MSDVFKTIKEKAEATFTEKQSKFLGHIFPVKTTEEVKDITDHLKKRYYDARHVCWAYMLGADRKDFRANDDGEPSGTAGKPILGQINSNELTNVLIVVVRYFGGIKLGTGGLIVAYREAAALAIAEAEITEEIVTLLLSFSFEYPLMNDVMRITKDLGATVVSQNFDMNCHMTVEIRKSDYEELSGRLNKIEGLTINDIDKQ